MSADKPQWALVRGIDWLSEWAGRAALALVVPLVLISAGNALVRYTLNYSSNGWLEIQWYLFAGIFLLGASYTLKHNAHVRIDLLFQRLSHRSQAIVDLVTIALFLLPFAALMVWLGWPFFHTSYVTGEVSSNVGGLVRWPVKALVPLGMALLLLQGIAEALKRLQTITVPTQPPADQPPSGHTETDRA